ncbi:MAG: flippase-like domain-containing protein [Halobacteriota archaeon]|nr:flippase-like domain-containing protein [Halobacteriota archaeon]
MDNVRRSLLISVTVSLVSIVLVIWLTMDSEDIRQLGNINPLYLILALIMHVGSWVVWSYRIKTLTRASGGYISFAKTFKIVVSSLFAAAITPSQAGGEPVRIYLLCEDMKAGDATAVIFADRFLDMTFLILISPLSLLIFRDVVFSGGIGIFLVFTVILFSLAIALTVLIMYRPEKIKSLVKRMRPIIARFRSEETAEKFVGRLDEEIENFVESMRKLSKRRSELATASICTVTYWSMEFLIASVIMMGLGYPAEVLHTYAAQILLTVIVLVPVTPGSSGIAEFGFAALFSTFAKGVPMGLFVVLWRFITYHFNLIAGGVAISRVMGGTNLVKKAIE